MKYIDTAKAADEIKEAFNISMCDLVDVFAEIPAEDVQPAPQWISVEERMPEIGRNVLIYYPWWYGDEIQVAKLIDDGKMFDICGEIRIMTGKHSVTHWMPLPEPPKE